MIAACLTIAFAQSDNLELAAMCKVDQSDRHFVTSPQEINWEKVSVRDAYRQTRVRTLLQEGEVKTATDFDNAALIMQHGSRSSDYLLAHELGAISGYLGNFGTLSSLAEDRWLESLGMKQRWGSQFDWDGNLKPMETIGAVVTDHMRKDMLLPTADAVLRLGMKATMDGFDARLAYISRRMDANLWKSSKTLQGKVTVAAALKLVRDGKLNTSEDYANAAAAISRSSLADELLLAHELSVVAMLRRSKRAPELFMRTLDAYLVATGLPKRYATGSISKSSARVLNLRHHH